VPTSKEFQNKNGKPKILPLQGDTGSFAALVARYSGDITLGAVVDELERVGVVTRPSKDKVELSSPGYIPHADELEKVEILSVCTADLLNSAVHNLDAEPEDRYFQRQLTYTEVPESMAESFRVEAAARSAQLLEQMQAFFSTQQNAELDTEDEPEPTLRIGLGIYYHDGTAANDADND